MICLINIYVYIYIYIYIINTYVYIYIYIYIYILSIDNSSINVMNRKIIHSIYKYIYLF